MILCTKASETVRPAIYAQGTRLASSQSRDVSGWKSTETSDRQTPRAQTQERDADSACFPIEEKVCGKGVHPLHRAEARLAPDLGHVAIHATNLAKQMQTETAVTRAHRGGIPHSSSFTLPSVRSHLAT